MGDFLYSAVEGTAERLGLPIEHAEQRLRALFRFDYIKLSSFDKFSLVVLFCKVEVGVLSFWFSFERVVFKCIVLDLLDSVVSFDVC